MSSFQGLDESVITASLNP